MASLTIPHDLQGYDKKRLLALGLPTLRQLCKEKKIETASPAPHPLSSAVPLPALKHSRRVQGPVPIWALLFMACATHGEFHSCKPH